MARLRKIGDEADARGCLRAAKLAGQSAREWARAHGVDGRSLHAWKLNLARGQGSPPHRRRPPKQAPATNGLIELVPATSPMSSAGRYVLEIAGARVEFGDDCSVATLRRVVEALRPC